MLVTMRLHHWLRNFLGCSDVLRYFGCSLSSGYEGGRWKYRLGLW
jgi:hypothetical protein